MAKQKAPAEKNSAGEKQNAQAQLAGGGSGDLFAGALRILLRPIVKFCIRRSIKLQRFVEVAKAVFVEVGQIELRQFSDVESVSRLSAMTGVHRRDVARLLADELRERPASDVYMRVLGQWRNHPDFSVRGRPNKLELGAGQGSFARLVASVSKEISCYSVLFEFERLGLIERSGDELALRANEYVPPKNPRETFELASADLQDLLAAVEENTFNPQTPPHLHLTTRYDNVCEEFLPQIRKWFMEEGAKLHHKARNYLSKFDKDMNPKLYAEQGGARVAIGSFSLVTESEKKKRPA